MKKHDLMKAVVAILIIFSNVLIFAFIILPSLLLAASPPDADRKSQVMNKAYRMQIPFIENKGQVENKNVSFYAKTFGGTLFVEKDGTLTYSFASEDKRGILIKEVVTVNKVTVQGLEPSPTKVNYFIGNDQTKWKSNIPSYKSVSLGEIYKGIEFTLKAYGKNVEKLFNVQPSADPEAVKVTLQGAKELKVNKKGELEILTDHGPITFTKPVAYQEIDEKRVEVEVSYKLEESEVRSQKERGSGIKEKDISTVSQVAEPTSQNPPRTSQITPSLQPQPTTPKQQLASYSFQVGDYNKSFPLMIDPLLASTFIGGGSNDYAGSIVVDGSGNVYFTGEAPSGYPTTSGAYDESYNGGSDVFISKLDSSLSTLLASTFIGGTENDGGLSITRDESGNIYVTGYAQPGYPTTPGAHNEIGSVVNEDVIISKLDSTLSTLIASTYIYGGGIEYGCSIALDGVGNVYVTGQAQGDFTTTPGAYDETLNGPQDVFISKLDNTLSTLIASTYLGGDGNSDIGHSITLDESANVYVTGLAQSGFPTTTGAYDESYNGGISFGGDAFIAKLNTDLSSLLSSTFIGGSSNDAGYSIALDGSGNIYVTGYAGSGYPTTPGAYDETYNGGPYSDVFVSKLNSSLSTLLSSTFIGGGSSDYGNSIVLDGGGNIYVTGDAGSGYPTTPGAYDETHNGGLNDVFVSKLDNTLNTLLASTFIGGGGHNDHAGSIVVDGSGNVYVTGKAESGFPTTPGAYDETFNGGIDVFVSKLDKSLLSDSDVSFKTAVNFGEEFAGGGQLLADLSYLDDPFDYVQCPSSTLTIDFWLTGWSGNNIKAIDYYFTWDTSVFNVEDIIPNTQWDIHPDPPDPVGNVYHLYLESSSGITADPDGDIKLHSVTLSIKTAPGSGKVKAELLPDGYVRDIQNNQYTSVGKTEITIQTICEINTVTECTETHPCDSLDIDDICPGDATVTLDNYSLTPMGVSPCEGSRISVFRTRQGSYVEEEVEQIVDICDSRCFNQCLEGYEVASQDCYVRCIKGCYNGLCDDWPDVLPTVESCELLKMKKGNLFCLNQCATSYNEETQTSYYNKLCGFSINEPITLRNANVLPCTGTVKGNPYTMTGAGTAGIGITLPFETGTGTYSYDICATSSFIQRVTVVDCGADCSITIPANALVANQGTNTSLNVTLANQNVGGNYDIELKRYQDDAHLIELSVPGSLQYPVIQNVQANGSVSFNINAIDAQPEGGQNHWANVIIRATSGSFSCEAAFDYSVVCPQIDTDSDGTIDCIDNCLITSNPDQLDSYPPGGNFIGDACDCEGNFDCDADVDGTDASTFKADFGRSILNGRCVTGDPCNGDFSCDGDVDGTDASKFKSDFGRGQFQNPCLACVAGAWCEY